MGTSIIVFSTLKTQREIKIRKDKILLEEVNQQQQQQQLQKLNRLMRVVLFNRKRKLMKILRCYLDDTLYILII
jgi:hypothetical protein